MAHSRRLLLTLVGTKRVNRPGFCPNRSISSRAGRTDQGDMSPLSRLRRPGVAGHGIGIATCASALLRPGVSASLEAWLLTACPAGTAGMDPAMAAGLTGTPKKLGKCLPGQSRSERVPRKARRELVPSLPGWSPDVQEVAAALATVTYRASAYCVGCAPVSSVSGSTTSLNRSRYGANRNRRLRLPPVTSARIWLS